MNTLTTEQLLDQAFGNNTSPSGEVNQALANSNQKTSKIIGVNVAIVTVTKQDSSLFLGSTFSIDVGLLEPYQYERGLPQQSGESLKAQIFHLSVQRQHEEYLLMRTIVNAMLERGDRELTVDWSEVDDKRFPFTVATWAKSGMTWHFTNRKIARPSGEKLPAADVLATLAQLL